MHRTRNRLLVLFGAVTAASLLGPTAVLAQTPGARIRQQVARDEIQPDGSDIFTQHIETQVLNPAFASALAQLPLTYNEAVTSLTIVEAYTLKPDGRKIQIDPAGIITQLPSGTSPLNAMFNDMKQKVLIFPDVEAGDTLVFTEKRQNKQPYFPGQFFKEGGFTTNVAVDDSTLTLVTPKSISLLTEAHDLDLKKSQEGENNIYTVHFTNPNPAPEQASLVSNLDRFPHYYVTTFKSYDDLGRLYGALVAPKMQVTAKIKSQADTITAGITGRREKAKAIYEWVSTHVRYVGIEFGQGVIIPHDADAILTNAYGDCKDHVVLLAALLKAEGIESVPVIINATNGYSISKVATFSQFNHMIAWLPEFKLYADTTARYVPFGALPLTEYGKPVLWAGEKDYGVHQVPVMDPDANSIKFTSVMTLDDQRRATAQSMTEATGAYAGQLHQLGAAIQAIGPEKAAKDLLTKEGKPLATGAFDVGSPDSLTAQYTVTSHFNTPRQLNFVAMPAGLRILPVALIGPTANTKIQDTDPTPCYNGKASEDLTLNLPASAHIGSLPGDTSLKTAHIQFASHWSSSGQTITIHREIVSNFQEPLCTGDVRKEAVSAQATIRKSSQTPLPISFGDGGRPMISVQSGAMTQINSHNRHSQDRDWPVAIKVTTAPAHGKVTVETGEGLIRTSTGEASHTFTKVFYQSQAGYVGTDGFTYERTSEDSSDPLNGRPITIQMDVKAPSTGN